MVGAVGAAGSATLRATLADRDGGTERGPLTCGAGGGGGVGTPMVLPGSGVRATAAGAGSGPAAGEVSSSLASPRPVSVSITRRNSPFSSGITICMGSGAGAATGLERTARCMRGRADGAGGGSAALRRRASFTGAPGSPAGRGRRATGGSGAGAGTAGSGAPAAGGGGRAGAAGARAAGAGAPAPAGAERAEPAFARATRERRGAGSAPPADRDAPGTGGSVERSEPADGAGACGASVDGVRDTATGGGASGAGEAGPSSILAPRLRSSLPCRPPTTSPGFSDILIAFAASPSKIHVACQSAIPRGISSAGAGAAGAGGALAENALGGASAAGAGGAGGVAVSRVAARMTRCGARAPATSPPRRPTAPRRGRMCPRRTGGREARGVPSPLDVSSFAMLVRPRGATRRRRRRPRRPRRRARRLRRGSGACPGARGRGSCRAASGGDRRVGPSPPCSQAKTAASFPQSTVLDVRQIHLELVRALGAVHDADRLAVRVHALVEALEVVEVRRVQRLDHLRRDLRDVADARDRAREQEDREVRLVAAHLRVPQRFDLVPGRRQPHRALAVQPARLVGESARERERDLGSHRSSASASGRPPRPTRSGRPGP